MANSSARISPVIHAAMTVAQAARLPYAVWRMPGAQQFQSLFSLSDLQHGTVFGDDRARPAFALARFDDDDASQADLIQADVLISGERVQYVDAAGHCAELASNDAQRDFIASCDAESIQAQSNELNWWDDQAAEAPACCGEQAYQSLVSRAVDAIVAGQLSKVVASRVIAREFSGSTTPIDLLNRLSRSFPTAFVCYVRVPGHGNWLLATPETLLSVHDGLLKTMALAGTQVLAAGAQTADVLWSDKFIEEQAFVARYIRQALLDCGFKAFSEAGPRTVSAGHLVHLRSQFDVSVGEQALGGVSQLLGQLHPTSAVCGMPKAAAIGFLREFEGYDRTYYGGYLGPVNVAGTSALFVNLRSARLIGHTAYCHVGAGIVRDSDPQAECLETEEKSKTILRAFGD